MAAARPAELSPTIGATQPYGTGKFTWFFITAYDASLWTDAPQWSMSAPFALSLRYNMSFTTDEIVERTIDEMRKIAPAIPSADLARYSAALSRAFPPVKDGDRITALHVPGKAVRFFHNGSLTAEIADAAFAEPFFGIWLSPRTAEPKLRAALLKLS
jgi:hypothetical protein